jgi:hypothetical protein
MLADAVLFCVLTLVVSGLDPSSLVGHLLLAIRFTIAMRLVWQGYVFLRTDLYYVISTAAGCTNLHPATSAYLRSKFAWLPGLRPASVDPAAWSERDRRAAPWFGAVTVAGVGFLLVTTVLGVVPVVVEFASRLVAALGNGPGSTAAFWDSTGWLVLNILALVVFPVLAGRRGSRKPSIDISSALR